MLECIILGDSIAVGAKIFRNECALYAKNGITSIGWASQFNSQKLEANSVIISLSTNDGPTVDTEKHLRSIRKKVTASKVFWIEPNRVSRPLSVIHVNNIAAEFKDVVIRNSQWQLDSIHPSNIGFKNIIEQTK